MSLRTIQQSGFDAATTSPNVPNTSIYNPIGDVACRRSAVIPAPDPDTISLRETDATTTATASKMVAVQSWALWQLSADYSPPGQPGALSVVVPWNFPQPGSDVTTITNNGSGEFTVAVEGVYEINVTVRTTVVGPDTWAAGSRFFVTVREGPASAPGYIYNQDDEYPPSNGECVLNVSFITTFPAGGQFCVFYNQPALTGGSLQIQGNVSGQRGCQISWRRIE